MTAYEPVNLFDAGPATVDIRMSQGDDFEMVIGVEGDVSADTFAAGLQPNTGAAPTAFTVAVGSYNAGTDETSITVTMADTVLDGFEPGLHMWGLRRTDSGQERQFAAGKVVLEPNWAA